MCNIITSCCEARCRRLYHEGSHAIPRATEEPVSYAQVMNLTTHAMVLVVAIATVFKEEEGWGGGGGGEERLNVSSSVHSFFYFVSILTDHLVISTVPVHRRIWRRM